MFQQGVCEPLCTLLSSLHWCSTDITADSYPRVSAAKCKFTQRLKGASWDRANSKWFNSCFSIL